MTKLPHAFKAILLINSKINCNRFTFFLFFFKQDVQVLIHLLRYHAVLKNVKGLYIWRGFHPRRASTGNPGHDLFLGGSLLVQLRAGLKTVETS